VKDGRMARAQADFSRDGSKAIVAPRLAQHLARRQDDASFVDAYIRWQLTGFAGASLPDLSDRQFDSFLASLPAMIENPRADRDLLDALSQGVKAGTLRPAAEEAVNKRLNDLAAAAANADAFNTPAIAFREWIIKQCQNDTPRRLVAMLEGVAARVQAGRPAEDAKQAFQAALEASARDREFTQQQRAAVIDRIRLSLGKKRLLVASASIQNHV